MKIFRPLYLLLLCVGCMQANTQQQSASTATGTSTESISQSQTNGSASSNPEMDRFVNELLAKMTLEEKIGQLNLVSIGFDVTGPTVSENVEANIQKGLVGGVFNNYTPIAVRKLQEMAVKQTRLGIPLLFGYDVVHGHRTIFPIPLGLSSSELYYLPLHKATAEQNNYKI